MPQVLPRKLVAKIWNDLEIFLKDSAYRLQLGALHKHPLYLLHIRAEKSSVSYNLRIWCPGPPLRHSWARDIVEELLVGMAEAGDDVAIISVKFTSSDKAAGQVSMTLASTIGSLKEAIRCDMTTLSDIIA